MPRIEFPYTLNSQEDLDSLVKDRLAREAKKYEGFEDFKAKAGQYDDLVAKDYPGQLEKSQKSLDELKAQLEKATVDAKAKADADAASIADLTSKLSAADLANTRTRVALSSGLPFEVADRLKGTTEEEIKADAEAMAPFFSRQAVQPIGGNDPAPSNKLATNPFAGNLTNDQKYQVYAEMFRTSTDRT